MKELKINGHKTWPQSLISCVENINKKVIDINNFHDICWTSGILPESDLYQLYRVLNISGPIRAYHYTRLLPHEVEDVKKQGLRIFSRKLFSEKISNAVKYGFIDSIQASQLIEGCLPNSRPTQNESREAIFYTTVCVYVESNSDIEHLVNYWGGEGTHFSDYGISRRNDLLCHLGNPTVVECLIPIRWGIDYVSGRIEEKLVLSYRGYKVDLEIEIHQKKNLRPENIFRIYNFDDFKNERLKY